MEDILDYEEEILDPDFYLASSGKRLANYFLDRIGVYVFIFSFIGLIDSDFLSEQGDALSTLEVVLLFFSTIGYWVLFEYFLGKTPAKFLTKTKVVTQDGQKPSFLNILGRTLCRFIPFEPFSFLGSKAVGWHDSISKTRVVTDKYKIHSDFI